MLINPKIKDKAVSQSKKVGRRRDLVLEDFIRKIKVLIIVRRGLVGVAVVVGIYLCHREGK